MTLRVDSADGWVPRVDRGELHVAHRRADGTLLAEGFACRAGVAEYRIGGRIVRELVRESTLQRAAHGLARQVVTLDHPDPQRYPDMVTPANVHELQVGDTDGEVEMRDGGYTKVRMAVRRKDALEAVDDGTHELSAGYLARIDARSGADPRYASPGNPEGRWDQEQVERSYNHLAIVDQARWGSTVRMRADAGVATTVISGTPPAATSNQGQPKARGGTLDPLIAQMIAVLGLTQHVDSDEAGKRLVVNALQQRKDAADQAATAHKAALDAAHAERDAAKARADAAEAKVKALEDAEKARADKADRERLDGIATAIGLDPKAHADSKALKRAIATKHLGTDLRADATDAYVDVLVDLAAQGREQRDDGREAGRQAWDFGTPEPARQDGQQAPPARQDGQGPKRRPTANEARLAAIEAARKART